MTLLGSEALRSKKKQQGKAATCDVGTGSMFSTVKEFHPQTHHLQEDTRNVMTLGFCRSRIYDYNRLKVRRRPLVFKNHAYQARYKGELPVGRLMSAMDGRLDVTVSSLATYK